MSHHYVWSVAYVRSAVWSESFRNTSQITLFPVLLYFTLQSNLIYPGPDYPETPQPGQDFEGTNIFLYICTRLSGNSRFRIRREIWDTNCLDLVKNASLIRNPDLQNLDSPKSSNAYQLSCYNFSGLLNAVSLLDD